MISKFASNGCPVNPFVSNAPFLYPMKTSENLIVFCFQGLENGCIGNEWVKFPKNFFEDSTTQIKLFGKTVWRRG